MGKWNTYINWWGRWGLGFVGSAISRFPVFDLSPLLSQFQWDPYSRKSIVFNCAYAISKTKTPLLLGSLHPRCVGACVNTFEPLSTHPRNTPKSMQRTWRPSAQATLTIFSPHFYTYFAAQHPATQDMRSGLFGSCISANSDWKSRERSSMAFSRHNIEKRRLIELVRLNPILWDCRLPHYKRSDKRKAIKWNELGRLFNVNGERVQRTFTSLREIFRRELNHEKMLGTTRFKSKWEYYDAMAFLKEVIRERK